MNVRAILYVAATLLALLSLAPMFGLLPPNGKVGIRIAFTLQDPVHWYVVHAILGWGVFALCFWGVIWLRRYPTRGRLSVYALGLLAVAAVFGSTLG